MDTRAGALARFARRGEPGADEPGADVDGAAELAWHRQVRELVARGGSEVMLGRMYDQLVEVLRHRPLTTVLTSREGAVEVTYRALAAALTP